MKELDTIVIALDYELKNKGYMKIVQYGYETIKYLVDGLKRVGIEQEKITVIGDSTGASILANIAMMEENHIPKQILLYPALDLTFQENYPSLEQNNKLDLLTLPHLKTFAKKYINEDYSSPLNSKDHKTWPNTLIVTGDLDPVRDEGIRLVAMLKAEKKKAKEINLKFATHGFLNNKDEETIEECIKEIHKFITKK